MQKNSSIQIEWVTITLGKVLIASADEVWLHTPTGDGDRFSETMTTTGSVTTTGKLLDGAMAAAKMAVAFNDFPPRITPNRDRSC